MLSQNGRDYYLANCFTGEVKWPGIYSGFIIKADILHKLF